MLRFCRLVRKSPLSSPFSSSSFDVAFFCRGYGTAAVAVPTLTDCGIYLAVVLGDGQAHAVYKLSFPWASPPRAGHLVEGEAATAAVTVLRSTGQPTNREARDVVIGAVKDGNMVVSTRLSPTTRSNSEFPHRQGCRFLLELSIWTRECYAFATLFQKKAKKGEWLWQSTFCYNMEQMSSQTGTLFNYQTGPIKSEHLDGRLEYKGVINDGLISSFKISLDSHYIVHNFLGSGGECEVHRCTYRLDSQECAVKSFYQSGILQKEPRESITMKYLCQRNVKRMFCSWKEESDGRELNKDVNVYVAQELCKRTLYEYLDGNSDICVTDLQNIFTEIVTGLGYIHQHGIVHRDIKCNNIFLNDNLNAKIGDFGHAAFIDSDSCIYGGRFYGTPLYVSPEVVSHKPHDEKSDIFSLGMLYYELFGPSVKTGERYMNAGKIRQLLSGEDWTRNPYHTWQKFELSEEWKGEPVLLIKMLQRSPEHRPSCAEIMANEATTLNEAQTNPIRRWLLGFINKYCGYFRRQGRS